MLLLPYCNPIKVLLLGSAALSLAACGGSGSYRVASVGSVAGDTGTGGSNGADGAAGPTGATGATGGNGMNGGSGASGGTGGNGANGMSSGSIPVASKLLVSAGNAVIGVSGKHNALAERVNGLAPGATGITGTVTTVLRKSGQTLVDLGQGQSLVLNSANGRLGEIVKVDLLSRTVTGANAASRLLGVSVLSSPVATGSLAGVNVGNGGPLLTLGNGGTAAGALAPVTGALAPVTGALTGGVTGGVTGGATSGLTGKVTGATNSSATVPVSTITGTAGLVGGLGVKKQR